MAFPAVPEDHTYGEACPICAGLCAWSLPGTPGPTLEALYRALRPQEKAALHSHLVGGTSAEWLSLTLTEHGHRISATTIKTYRRSLNATAG